MGIVKSIYCKFIKVLEIMVSILVKCKNFVLCFFVCIKKAVSKLHNKIFKCLNGICIKIQDWYEINVFQKEKETLTIKDLVLAEVFFLVLLVLIRFGFKQFDSINAISFVNSYLTIIFTILIILIMIFLFFKYERGHCKNQCLAKTCYIVSTLLIIMFFILAVLPLLPIFIIIDLLRYKNKDSKLVFYIKRIVKMIISLLFLLLLIVNNIIKGYNPNSSQQSIIALSLTVVIVYLFVPFMTCDIFRLYSSKKEAFKDLSIVLIIVIIMIKFILLILSVDIPRAIDTVLDIFSWIFALIGMGTWKFVEDSKSIDDSAANN